MLNKTNPAQPRFFHLVRPDGGAGPAVRRGFFSILFFFSAIAIGCAQTDSLPVAYKDSAEQLSTWDTRLSTDSNTQEVDEALNSLYVPASQETRRIPPSTIKRLQNEEPFAYANDPAYWRRRAVSQPPTNTLLYFRIFLIVCGCFLVYGIYRLASENFSGLFVRRVKKTKQESGSPGIDDESLSTAGLDERIAAAVAAGDLRTAVRLLYLKLIRGLQDRQLVPAGMLATNRAWTSVFSDPALAGQFRSLASAYEYVYYGGFVPTEQQFAELQQRFADFTVKLPA